MNENTQMLCLADLKVSILGRGACMMTLLLILKEESVWERGVRTSRL